MSTSSPRITARVDLETQHLLTKAASLAGMTSINSFVLSAAVEKAKQIIEQEQVLKLSEEDALLLVRELDKEPSPNRRLQEAAARYQGKTQK